VHRDQRSAERSERELRQLVPADAHRDDGDVPVILAVVALACACGRVGFEPIAATTDAAPRGDAGVADATAPLADASSTITCAAGSPCDAVATTGAPLVVICTATDPCRVECSLASSCTVDCAFRSDCIVSCPATSCLVTDVPPDDSAIGCAGVALPTRMGTTATCP
jgi:hypothetical protein